MDDHTLEVVVEDNPQLRVALLGLSETFLGLVVVALAQIFRLACPSQLCVGSV